MNMLFTRLAFPSEPIKIESLIALTTNVLFIKNFIIMRNNRIIAILEWFHASIFLISREFSRMFAKMTLFSHAHLATRECLFTFNAFILIMIPHKVFSTSVTDEMIAFFIKNILRRFIKTVLNDVVFTDSANKLSLRSSIEFINQNIWEFTLRAESS